MYATPIFDLYGLDLKIVHLEMLNLVIALRLWSKKWARSTIKFYYDNLAVVQAVRTSKTKDHILALCLRNIWLIATIYDIQIEIDRTQGTSNKIAHLLSRLYSDKAVDLTLLTSGSVVIHILSHTQLHIPLSIASTESLHNKYQLNPLMCLFIDTHHILA